MEEESAHVNTETLTMASTQTLKSSDKKCEKDEVFELANNSIER